MSTTATAIDQECPMDIASIVEGPNTAGGHVNATAATKKKLRKQVSRCVRCPGSPIHVICAALELEIC